MIVWAVSAVNNRHLVLRALDAAHRRRGPCTGLLHHSDQGSPYASGDCQRALVEPGDNRQHEPEGNRYDNAVIKAFFSTVKAELGEHFANNCDSKDKLFDAACGKLSRESDQAQTKAYALRA